MTLARLGRTQHLWPQLMQKTAIVPLELTSAPIVLSTLCALLVPLEHTRERGIPSTALLATGRTTTPKLDKPIANVVSLARLLPSIELAVFVQLEATRITQQTVEKCANPVLKEPSIPMRMSTSANHVTQTPFPQLER